jgi:hypothetical protein
MSSIALELSGLNAIGRPDRNIERLEMLQKLGRNKKKPQTRRKWAGEWVLKPALRKKGWKSGFRAWFFCKHFSDDNSEIIRSILSPSLSCLRTEQLLSLEIAQETCRNTSLMV